MFLKEWIDKNHNKLLFEDHVSLRQTINNIMDNDPEIKEGFVVVNVEGNKTIVDVYYKLIENDSEGNIRIEAVANSTKFSEIGNLV